RIGTIHSFCAELLRQRPVEAKIPPGFEELDENQSASFYTRAFNSWIQSALQRMPEGIRRTLSRFGAEYSKDGNGPLDQIRAAGWMLVEWRDLSRPWRRGEFDQLQEIELILPEVAELAQMASACNVALHPVRKHLQCVVDFVDRLHRSDKLRARDHDEL